jgi:hypothetical protein
VQPVELRRAMVGRLKKIGRLYGLRLEAAR